MISSKVHGNLDYITALFFLAAPSLFPLSQTGTILSYALAIVHFLMTIFTGFSLGLIKIIPLKFHGYVELIVGLALIVVPWILADSFSQTDEVFYAVCGAAILGFWFISDYQNANQKDRR